VAFGLGRGRTYGFSGTCSRRPDGVGTGEATCGAGWWKRQKERPRVDIFSQFSGWLDTLLTSISDNFWLSMVFIFLVSIGECVFILGLFVPSTPVLLLTGSLMAVGRLPFWPIYFAAVIGAVIGDAISYWVGRLLEHRLKEIWPFVNYKPQIAKGEEFF